MPSVSRRRFFQLASALLPSRWLLAQDPTFSTDVNVVNVLATVRNNKGEIVRDLTKNDFTLDEDGHPQVIKYFSQQTDLPLTLGLLVDTSGSQRNLIERERNASREFLWHVMREDKDKAFVIHFDTEVELLQDLTSSHKQLDAALDEIESPRQQLNRRRTGAGGPPQGQGGPRRFRGGTTLYDAVLLASDEVQKKQQGRKAVIVLSDGVDNGSRVSLTSAIESAQRADTLVYSIRFADPDVYGAPGGGPPVGFPGGRRGRGGLGGPAPGGGVTFPRQQNRTDGKKVLERMAKETGGSYFEVGGKMPLDKIYDRIEEELRNQYNLGYTSDSSTPGYRKIHVATRKKDLTVQARDGYYARS